MAGDEKDYEVGYGKPPKHTQFKKGESGNSKGRPRGAGALDKYHLQEAQSRVTVTLDGRAQRMSKGEVVVRQQWDRAVKGDMKAYDRVTERLDRIQEKQEGAANAIARDRRPTELAEESYEAALEHYLNTYRKTGGSEP